MGWLDGEGWPGVRQTIMVAAVLQDQRKEQRLDRQARQFWGIQSEICKEPTDTGSATQDRIHRVQTIKC